jgi:hypothetical protein
MTVISMILSINALRFLHQDYYRPMDHDELITRRLHYIAAIVKGEFVIFFFYVLSAFLYNRLWLMKSYYSITWKQYISYLK